MIKPDELISGIRLSSWAFMIALIIFFIYLNSITKPVLNFDNRTNTILYPEQCFISHQELTQEYVNLCSIPKDYVKIDNIAFGLILILGLISTLLSDKGKMPEMADIIEAKEKVKKYLDTHKDIRLDTGEIINIGKYRISPNFLLTEERVVIDNKPERIPERYVLDVIITDLDDMEHYIRAYMHPFKRYLKGFVSADKPLEELDRCGNCGKEFDVEFKDTKDYVKFKKLKEEMTRI